MILEILTSAIVSVVPTPKTNGAVNPAVTQATINKTICVVGWTSTIRPPYSYTEPIKVAQIKAYGYKDTSVHDYEEDHIIPLELGGSAKSVKNLWPEPHPQSYTSDGMENHLKYEVCDGKITLAQGRAMIVAYKKSHG
jgi:hypothetical protein